MAETFSTGLSGRKRDFNKKEEKIIKICHKDLMNFGMIWPLLISKQWRL